MDDTDARLAKGKTSVLSDPSVIARRKRMEIRRFKKIASSTQLLSDDPLSLADSIVCIKRPRIGQTIMELTDPLDDKQENTALSPSLRMEVAKFPLCSRGKDVIEMDCTAPPASATVNDIGLLRYKSLPPKNNFINKVRCSSPDADVDKGPTVKLNGYSACLLSRTLEQQRAGSSTSEGTHSLPPSHAPSSAVHVTEHPEIENSKAELISPSATAEHGICPCRVLSENATTPMSTIAGTSDAEMIDLANESSTASAHTGVGLSTSQSIDSSSLVLSDRHSPPSGKLLVCGRRREMEDAATIALSFCHLPRDTSGSCLCNGKLEDRPVCDLHFFAVYDGHGGSQASNFCMENLHHVLAEELAGMQEGNSEQSEGSSSLPLWEKAMTPCFSRMDREVGGVCPNGLCDDADSSASCCTDSIAPENVGTTAVVAVVSLCQIVVANCGDSRAVLSRGGMAVPLSRDHKPDRDDEYSRIEAAGGRVIYWDGHRVGGLLALSRAIGDRYLKRYVVSKPEVTCLQRTEEDECLILASDGLWDVISNDTACEIARKCLDSSRKKRASGTFALGEDPACAAVAALLIKLAYGRGSKDNISVVVIDLKA